MSCAGDFLYQPQGPTPALLKRMSKCLHAVAQLTTHDSLTLPLRFPANFITQDVSVRTHKNHDAVSNRTEWHRFKFPSVLHNASQETVYQSSASDVVRDFVSGTNGAIMAYGQTAAGKVCATCCTPLRSSFAQAPSPPRHASSPMHTDLHHDGRCV